LEHGQPSLEENITKSLEENGQRSIDRL